MQPLNNQLNELALFAGAGGGILGGKLLGWRTVCAVEWDAYARDILVARQNDGCLEAFPIWNDIQTFDGRPWRGSVDVVSGGFPCQDISAAGKGVGIEGERSSMWKHMARIIGEVRPQFAFVENSPMLVGRGLAIVLADLAKLGYDAEWGIVGAHHAAAPHKRDRIWLIATDSNLCRCDDGGNPERQNEVHHAEVGEAEKNQQSRNLWKHRAGENGRDVGNSTVERFQDRTTKQMGEPRADTQSKRSDWWATEPDVGRVAHGVASRVDRLRCIGNGQVPTVAKIAWNLLNP
jgi:DNA (cytosine-5)-methyltransferase 1